jgi:hypothetical protein
MISEIVAQYHSNTDISNNRLTAHLYSAATDMVVVNCPLLSAQRCRGSFRARRGPYFHNTRYAETAVSTRRVGSTSDELAYFTPPLY